MEALQISLFVISLIIGYVLGSLNPGYLIGRMKGMDIRKIGTNNPGTSNVWHSLGKKYGILTAAYDIFKSLISCIIAIYLLQLDYFLAQFAGIMAIIGHVFPFYLRFHGGKGVAAAIGMLPYYVSMYLITSEPYDLTMIFLVLYLVPIALLFIWITKLLSMLAWIVFPILGYAAYYYYPGNEFNIFFLLHLAFLFGFVTYSAAINKKFPLKGKIFKNDWIRMLLRFLSIFFLVFYVIFTKPVSLIIIIIFIVLFVSIDLRRIFKHDNSEITDTGGTSLYRSTEGKSFSSISIYLVAFFVTLLAFPMEIAFSAIIFLIFGDIFSKVLGLIFGRHKILDKTIEGTLAYGGSMALCGYILFTILNISPIILIFGAITAPITELLSIKINDNFTVSIISGTVMLYVGFLLGLYV
jgi:acyl phosphate:glycerol-3-phosphate acyltransferase